MMLGRRAVITLLSAVSLASLAARCSGGGSEAGLTTYGPTLNGDPKVKPGEGSDAKCPNFWAPEDAKDPSDYFHHPLTGDPELGFCRRLQFKHESTCCMVIHDEDIQEEFEELVGGGYQMGQIFIQQYHCLTCHPKISCLINEKPDSKGEKTLQLPKEFGRRLLQQFDDFDKTGLKVKVDQPCEARADDFVVPSQWYSAQVRNASECEAIRTACYNTPHGADAPEHCAAPAACEYPPTYHNMEAVRQLLLAARAPGFNAWDGFLVNISWVENDDCGVLPDLVYNVTKAVGVGGAEKNGASASALSLGAAAVAAAGVALLMAR